MNPSAPVAPLPSDAVGDEAGRLAFWRRRASVFADACRFLSNTLAAERKPRSAGDGDESIQARMKRLAASFDDEGRNATTASDIQAVVTELATQAGYLLYRAIDGGAWHEKWPWEKGFKPARNLFIYVDDFRPIPTDQLEEVNRCPEQFREGERVRLPQPQAIPDEFIAPHCIAHSFWIATLNIAGTNPREFSINPHRLYQVDANALHATSAKPSNPLADGVYEDRDIVCAGMTFKGVPELERLVFGFMVEKERAPLGELCKIVWKHMYLPKHRHKIQSRVSHLNQRIEKSGVSFSVPKGQDLIERKRDESVTPESRQNHEAT